MSERGSWPERAGGEVPATEHGPQQQAAPQYPAGGPGSPEAAPPTWPGATQGGYRGWGPEAGQGQGGWYPPGGYPPAPPPPYGQGPYGTGQAPLGPRAPLGAPSPQPPGPGPALSARAKLLRSAAAVLVVVAAAAAGAGVSRVAWPGGQTAQGSSPPATSPTTSPIGGGNAPLNAASVGALVDPAVVDVNVAFTYNDAEGAGTGIVISPNGLVITNNHVIDQSTKVTATDVGNGRTYAATVLGYDPTVDIALLKLKGASGLVAAKIDPKPPSVGEPVVAVGNAGGQGGVPTSAGGTITALDQDISATDSLTDSTENLTGLIESDADIQEGDSGGPLVNTKGQVIGVDTAASESFAFAPASTQGFSIPIGRALRIAKDIEAGRGTSTVHVGPTAFIGLQLYQAASSPFSLPGAEGTQPAASRGLEVYQAIPGTPAAKAGISGGDVLKSLDGTTLTSGAQLSHLMVRLHPGDRAEVGWVTPTGQSKSASITLAAGPPA